MMKKIAAVVFDLDGTLIDSAPDLRVAVNKLLARKGRRPLDLPEVVKMIGNGVPKLVERAFAATGVPADEEDIPLLAASFLDFYEGHASVRTKPFPGVLETLATLKGLGIKLGVCTNKPQAPTEEILGELGLIGFFDAIVGGDVLPVKKPDPAHPLAVLEKLGVTVDQAIMVGDAEPDVGAGMAAGIYTVAVTFGYAKSSPATLGANRLIDRFSELPEIVKGLP